MDGILLVDKPKGWTSFDVVAKVRGTLRAESREQRAKIKVGHTGTLDPLATGLLVILVGKYTKKAPELTKLDKTYEVTTTLGQTSSTGDAEGEISPYVPPSAKSQQSRSLPKAPGALPHQDLRSSVDVPVRTPSSGAQSFLALHPGTNGENNQLSIQEPTRKELQTAVEQFVGEIMQTPPIHSAIKVNGQRAYKLARQGKEVKLEPRKVTIYRLEINDYSYPTVKFTAKVSSGTYIRSMVEDIGQKLGTGAYMSDLRRTQIGEFKLQSSQQITDLELSKLLTI